MDSDAPQARPRPTFLLTLAFLLAATATPAAAILEPVADAAGVEACQAESLDRDVVLGCIVAEAEWSLEDAGDNAGSTPDPLSSDGCWRPEDRKTVWGDPEDKWTPLYGTNSPRYGYGTVEIESGQTVSMSIGFTFEGSGVQLNDAQTTTVTSTLTAENGQSAVIYQLLEWKEYTRKRCGWDFEWHTTSHGYAVTEYNPNGGPLPTQKTGDLTGPSADRDNDNYLRPQGTPWSTDDNTIGLDLRWKSIDGDQCLKNVDKWFGSEVVYHRGAQLSYEGVMQAGFTRSETEANTFRYHFDDGCYLLDALGYTEGGGVGLAFNLYDDDADTGGSECAAKSALEEGLAACEGEACTDKYPSEDTVQGVVCDVVPICSALEEAPFICAMPEECGAGGEPGEACVPGLPGKPSCPPPSVALPVASCDPCDAIPTTSVGCSAPHPTCEDAGLDCPPVAKPCGEYAEGMAGQVAKWVCEGGDDPCDIAVLATLEDLLACGAPPED